MLTIYNEVTYNTVQGTQYRRSRPFKTFDLSSFKSRIPSIPDRPSIPLPAHHIVFPKSFCDAHD